MNSTGYSMRLRLNSDSFSFKRLAREYYRRYILPNSKVPAYTRRILKSELLPVWKDRDARTIKPREVVDLLDTVVDRGSPVMANRISSVMKQLFLYGIQRAILEDTPVKLLGKPGGKERPKKRALTANEMQAFVQNMRLGMSVAPTRTRADGFASNTTETWRTGRRGVERVRFRRAHLANPR